MASSARRFVASLLLFVLASDLVHAHRVLQAQESFNKGVQGFPISTSAAVAPSNCGGACAVRCSQSSRPNLCQRACGTCCARCSCVPPGTYGNYDSCACYAAMTTRGGVRKCP